mmetsp:Transcript_104076/g.204131  ORF Transcript_104076/g.204131 Transcript_104076/m.204131 type:complete len:494 (-) Transcript_104076:72-1553(-)|eukprot:CAMPEP_0170378996 /NCGR_PEP_ID=MMETSP0117_2-20130122/13106_1 /TAXON_ID=400756 /ORGANISM="Durinskia baltica, Strain CSIRO CS-38" /LENGTH=493 /DNA_ID=CAMNT_0010634403 /DNA_START=41 /DNA_END=1522 /DNA_ORIENTATION=-
MSNAPVDLLHLLQKMAPELAPLVGAMALASLIVLVSTSFTKMNKVYVQATLFAAAVAAGVSYLFSHQDPNLIIAWNTYAALSVETRFCLSLILIGAVYFGGSMYIAAPEEAETVVMDHGHAASVLSVFRTPACVDTSVSFDVPAELPQDDKVFFEEMLDKLCKEILEDLPVTYELNAEGTEWVGRMMSYTVAGGKMNRGLATLSVRKTFAKLVGHSLNNKERCQAAALGWCIEFLQAFFLVADDLMDDSVTRRGQPCWFRLPEVKTIAVNDSFILESFVYKILKKYFGQEVYYYQLVDLFLETTRQTEFGQLLDLTSQKLGEPIDLSRFTIERYTAIVKYKTAFYSFYLPVACGMIIAGIHDESLYRTAREILLIMGEYFQIQDDYLDCYGTPEVIGKIGTDIQDNKCSWLVVQALDHATPKQRKVLEDNYGRHEPAKIAKVKKLYEEMGLEEMFLKYEEESYARIQELLQHAQDLPTEVFEFLLRKIYKRSK